MKGKVFSSPIEEQKAKIRQTAWQRLPPWLRRLSLLLNLSCVLVLASLVFTLAVKVYGLRHPGMTTENISSLTAFSFFFLAFIAAISPSVAAVNILLWSIKPIGRILDENAKDVPDLSFRARLAQSIKAGLIFTPASLLLIGVKILQM
ncbi:MAG: hypothetical protein PHY92_08035 [Alphaproteobacteria bacterium]|nr:hypothetical protein [Alphaproteobacteria bacterium]